MRRRFRADREEMAAGALAASHAQVAVAVSGVAGPAGGTSVKPVGMVCLAWALGDGRVAAETRNFAGDREAVRRQNRRARAYRGARATTKVVTVIRAAVAALSDVGERETVR